MMSEPETKNEIEDVLSSIRRLVSRDAVTVRTMPTAQRASAPAPVSVPTPQPTEADCLVLSPALRIEETEGELAVMVPQASEPEVGFVADATEAVAEAEVVASELQDFTAPFLPEPEDLAEDMPIATESEPLQLADTVISDMESAFDLGAPLLLQPSEAVVAAEILPFVPPAPPRPMTEAEVLLAEAEAALLETGTVLDDATNAIDAVGESEDLEVEPVADPVGATDLGDELSRLESTIAELEAAVAESGFDFEPETGHPFAVEATEDVDGLVDAVATDMGAGTEAPLTEAVAEPQCDEPAEEAIAEPTLAAVEETAEAWEEDAAEDAAEAEVLAQQEHAAELQAEMTDPEVLDQLATADDGVGMDWAEATLNLARRTPPRRLAVSDAEETVQTAATMRSSYEELREELAQDLGDPESLYAEDLVPSYEDGLIDEAVLRDMVAQLVREELRGSLGERITQNVRKLVRREIQRALMGQDFE